MNRYKIFSALELMKTFEPEWFYVIGTDLGAMKTIAMGIQARDGVSAEFPDGRDPLISQAEKMKQMCHDAGLTVSYHSARRLITCLQKDPVSASEVLERMKFLEETVYTELVQQKFLQISSSRLVDYECPNVGWEQVIEKFPSTQVNIEEGRKCFALGRWTASVFHMMGIAEVGLSALASALEVKHEFKNWDPVIRKLRSILDTEYERVEEKWKRKGTLDRFRGACDRLNSIKEAIRNPTMHLRITVPYDEEMTNEVIHATRSFMKNLSEWLSEPPA